MQGAGGASNGSVDFANLIKPLRLQRVFLKLSQVLLGKNFTKALKKIVH